MLVTVIYFPNILRHDLNYPLMKRDIPKFSLVPFVVTMKTKCLEAYDLWSLL